MRWSDVVLTFYQTKKIGDQSNLKTSADDILNVVQMMTCVTDWVESIVGTGEIAGYQHFSPFPTMFSRGFISRVIKSRECVVELNI